MLAGLLAYVGIAYGLQLVLRLDDAVALSSPIALLMALIPALLWLGYFYLQDRHEPEPKHYVLGSFILGAFVAAPTAAFLVDLAMGQGAPTLHFSTLAVERWVAAIAIFGLAQEGAKYLVVRYSLYLSPEFDEPVDGIIYMSAAGIGFAVYESYHYLQSGGAQIFLSTAAAQCVVTTLAHASFAGVLGFALGRAKFLPRPGHERSITIAAGLLSAAAPAARIRGLRIVIFAD